jgi:hypothetical protein
MKNSNTAEEACEGIPQAVWEEFEMKMGDGSDMKVSDLYRLARLLAKKKQPVRHTEKVLVRWSEECPKTPSND